MPSQETTSLLEQVDLATIQLSTEERRTNNPVTAANAFLACFVMSALFLMTGGLGLVFLHTHKKAENVQSPSTMKILSKSHEQGTESRSCTDFVNGKVYSATCLLQSDSSEDFSLNGMVTGMTYIISPSVSTYQNNENETAAEGWDYYEASSEAALLGGTYLEQGRILPPNVDLYSNVKNCIGGAVYQSFQFGQWTAREETQTHQFTWNSVWEEDVEGKPQQMFLITDSNDGIFCRLRHVSGKHCRHRVRKLLSTFAQYQEPDVTTPVSLLPDERYLCN